jgi:hypothetical protein
MHERCHQSAVVEIKEDHRLTRHPRSLDFAQIADHSGDWYENMSLYLYSKEV